MNEIVLKEKFDVEMMKKLIYSNKIDKKDQIYLINKLKKYPDGIFEVKYKNDTFGRLKTSTNNKHFVPHYMIGTRKIIRSILAHKYYIDLDIKNCHPVLIYQIAKKNNILLTELKKYIDDRETILSNISESWKISKTNVKTLIIRILHGGSIELFCEENNIIYNNIPEFLINLKSETKKIRDVIINDENNKSLIEWAEKKKDISVFAHYVQTEEKKCLLSMYNFMLKNNIIVGALIHDGLMIEKSDKIINNDFLNICSRYILGETGYNVEIMEKPMIIDEKLIEGDEESYDYKKLEFETNHLKILYPAIYVKENNNLFFMTTKQLNETYSHLNYKDYKADGEEVKKNFVSTWIKDENIRKYDSIDFLPPPLTVADNIYNQWSGFAAEKINVLDDYNYENETNEILEVFKVLCGDNQSNWLYFEKWIAQMIQQPGHIIGISVLLKSIEGCGKGFICEVIKKIIGDEYFYQSGNAETDVFNRFSTALRFRIFININECKAKTNYDYNDLIKHIITAPSITYEEKGKQSIVIRNCARLLFTTNNDFAMPITEDERRFVIFECSTKYKGDAQKWNKLFRYIENPKIIKQLYLHFMNVDINHVNWINDRPKTEAYTELIKYNIPKELKFITDLAINGYKNKEEEIEIPMNHMYKKFREYLDKTGCTEYSTNSIKLGLQMNKYKELYEKNKTRVTIIYKFKCKKILDYAVSKHVISEDEVPDFGATYTFYDDDVETNLLDE